MTGSNIAFTCACCGKTVSGLPDLAFDAPFHYAALSGHPGAADLGRAPGRPPAPLVWVNRVHGSHPLYIDQREGIATERLGEICASENCGGGDKPTNPG